MKLAPVAAARNAGGPSYHICVVEPSGHEEGYGHEQLAELISLALSEMGVPSITRGDRTRPECVNLIIGAHLMKQETQAALPSASVIINTVPLFVEDSRSPTACILQLACKYEIWDCNEKNLASLKVLGFTRTRLLRLGYQRQLERIPRSVRQDIDVLFYGSFSERRIAVLGELQRRGLNVRPLFGVTGRELDAFISRSKVVLNMHYNAKSVFEALRVCYLMNNAKAVVSETDPASVSLVESSFHKGIRAVPYAQLAQACAILVDEAETRHTLEDLALATVKASPQSRFLKALVADHASQYLRQQSRSA